MQNFPPPGASSAHGPIEAMSADELRSLLVKNVVAQAPRILGLQCRVPSMRTYGLFDRAFWNYAVVNIPNARMQEAALTLALLYVTEHPENPYAGASMLREWALAGMRTWAAMQLKSGAFNDLYPNEHSYVATAFSGYAVAEACRLLGWDTIPVEVMAALRRCGRFLAGTKPSSVLNQVCGAAAALAVIGQLLDEEKFVQRAGENMIWVGDRQSPEGWLPEYGGPDIGYLSVALDYMGKYYIATKDPLALEIAGHALDFLSHFVHPDGSVGGEYGSRSTEYIVPDGLAIFSSELDRAALILAAFGGALASRTSASLAALDDKYLLFNGYTYLQAATRPFILTRPFEAASKGRFSNFEQSGLAVCRTGNLTVIANLRKGGTFYAHWPSAKISIHDSGLLFRGKQWWTSCLLGCSEAREVSAGRLTCRGRLGRPIDNRTGLLKNSVLGAVATLAGTTAAGAETLKRLLRRIVMGGNRTSGPPFERTIALGEDGSLVVVDEGEVPDGAETVLVGARLDTIYGESARYFVPSQLTGTDAELNVRSIMTDRGSFRIRRVLRPGDGDVLKVDLTCGQNACSPRGSGK